MAVERAQAALFAQFAQVGFQHLFRVEMDVPQEFVDGIAALRLCKTVPPIGGHDDIHRIGVAEQVVHVTQDLLIGADQKNTQEIGLPRAFGVQRQRSLDAVLIDITRDAAIRITGQVVQQARVVRRLIETVEWHHWKDLVNRPDIRQRLEQGKIAEHPIGEQFVEGFQQLAGP